MHRLAGGVSGDAARIGRRNFIKAMAGALAGAGGRAYGRGAPNVVLILADDLGYGDLGCYGSALPTPHLDAMAGEGVRMERAYAASPVCSPSRAALLTGRYPARCGVTNVLLPSSQGGLSSSELTIPRLLKEAGYRTACVGKWHLGSTPESLPGAFGFDEFDGVPYSNDLDPPLVRNGEIVDMKPAQSSLGQRFTENAVDFIYRNREAPFFLYLAHTAPHIPLEPSEPFRNRSGHGRYGDVVAELDWSTGQVLNAIRRAGIDEQTLVVFTSDNGPWFQGSAGRLQGRKGSTYEGGVRVPFIARYPGRIEGGRVSPAMTSLMDLLPTFSGLAGIDAVPAAVDGVNLWPVLSGEKRFASRGPLLFFDGWEIQCVALGPWKLHVSRYNSHPWTVDPPGGRVNLPLQPPELYNVEQDPSESYDCADENEDVVRQLLSVIERMLPSFPEQVRSAWRETRNRPAVGIPAGAIPRRP